MKPKPTDRKVSWPTETWLPTRPKGRVRHVPAIMLEWKNRILVSLCTGLELRTRMLPGQIALPLCEECISVLHSHDLWPLDTEASSMVESAS